MYDYSLQLHTMSRGTRASSYLTACLILGLSFAQRFSFRERLVVPNIINTPVTPLPVTNIAATPKLGQDISKNIKLKQFPDVFAFPNGHFEIQDAELTKNIKLKVPLPPVSTDSTPTIFRDVGLQVLASTMPKVLIQFGYSEEQIAEKMKLSENAVIDGVIALVNGQDLPPNKRYLVKRSILDVFSGIGCAAFAAIGTPAFLLAAGDFKLLNNGARSEGITPHQQFFINPIYGNFALNGR